MTLLSFFLTNVLSFHTLEYNFLCVLGHFLMLCRIRFTCDSVKYQLFMSLLTKNAQTVIFFCRGLRGIFLRGESHFPDKWLRKSEKKKIGPLLIFIFLYIPVFPFFFIPLPQKFSSFPNFPPSFLLQVFSSSFSFFSYLCFPR